MPSYPSLLAVAWAAGLATTFACSSKAPGPPASPAAAVPPRPPPPMSSPVATNAAPAVPSAATTEPPPAEAPAPPPPRCAEGTRLVPGGEFTRAGSKKPATVTDLCVDTHETTATEYAECVQAGQCTNAGLDCAAQATYGHADKANHPVVCVDFEQAEAYCAYRNKRLPSLEEWEWAARGGGEARRYPWGNDEPTDQLCWTGHEKRTETCAVESYPAGNSVHGISDMAGNVLEFTTTSQDARSEVRIARGGSWRAGAPELVRVTRVGGFGVAYRCGFLGIRCVSEAPGEPNAASVDESIE